jgi:hypothetical protein
MTSSDSTQFLFYAIIFIYGGIFSYYVACFFRLREERKERESEREKDRRWAEFERRDIERQGRMRSLLSDGHVGFAYSTSPSVSLESQ